MFCPLLIFRPYGYPSCLEPSITGKETEQICKVSVNFNHIYGLADDA